MGAKQRILEYLKLKGIEKSSFARDTGFSRTILDSGENLGSEKLEIIISIYDDINLLWLVTGKGNMFLNKEQPSIENSKNIFAYIDKEIHNKIENLNNEIQRKLYIKYLEDMKDYLTLDEKVNKLIEELNKIQKEVHESKINQTNP